VHICPGCKQPTFHTLAQEQVPGRAFGAFVEGVTDPSVSEIYEEARRAYGAQCYTAVVLCCRKLLMHVAVAEGAEAGMKFIDYLNFFEAENLVPKKTRGWIDHIRTKGNEATREIVISSVQDANDLMRFVEMLLRVVFEFDHTIKQRNSAIPP
jgi:hypothetical protein